MNNDIPEEIAADLPPPRSDEPTSLRQDIIDELADHLTCSVQREQFREGAAGQSESQIWKRVLQRFGSPGDVARRLWFDWMWEKIVMQRVTVFLLVAMVACTIAMFVTMNQSLQASRESQAMLMKELLAIKDSKPITAAPSQPTEWNNLKIKVVYDDENKTPVEGAKVTVTGQTDKTRTIPEVRQLTDSTGEIDCGMVLYGKYGVELTLAKDEMLLNTNGHIATVHPGQDELFEIVVLQALTREVEFQPDLSEDIKVTDFDESRIWCLNRQLDRKHVVTRRQQDGRYESAVSNPQNTRNPMEGIFITTHGVIESTELERVDPQERFAGLLDAKDERIHRFSNDRLLIPKGVQLKASVPLGYGKYTYQSYNIDLYLEMKLTDGRRILTKIPDLYAPRFFNPRARIPQVHYKQEFESFREMIKQGLAWKYYTTPHSGVQKSGMKFFGASGEVKFPDTRCRVSDFLTFGSAGDQTLPRKYNFSVLPHLGENSAEPVEVQIHPSQQYLATLNFLANIPTDLMLVAANLTLPNDVSGWQSQKFDLFLSGPMSKEETLIDREVQTFDVLAKQSGGAGYGGGGRSFGAVGDYAGQADTSKAFCLIGIKTQNFATAFQSLMKAANQDAGNFRFLTLTAKPSLSDAPEFETKSDETKKE